jgi:hypothetical protein
MKIREIVELFDREYERVSIGPSLLWSDTQRLKHPDPLLASLRTHSPIHCGDFELEMWVFERALHPFVTFEDFAANWLETVARRGPKGEGAVLSLSKETFEAFGFYVENLKYASPPTATSAAGMLWELTSFGELYFGWIEQSLRAGIEGKHNVYLQSTKGERFIPRIWEFISPLTQAEDIVEHEKSVLRKLEQMPTPTWGLSRDAYRQVILELFVELREVCDVHGTYGEAVLPDAHEPIEEVLLIANDGNDREVLYKTSTHFSAISFHTS